MTAPESDETATEAFGTPKEDNDLVAGSVILVLAINDTNLIKNSNKT